MNEIIIHICSGILKAITMSFVLTLIFDLFYIIFSEFNGKTKTVLFTIKDFISVITYTLFFVLLLYYWDDGVFRGIYLISVLITIYFYYKIFSQFFRKVSRILLFPLIYVIRTLRKIIRKILYFLSYAIEKIKYKLYNKNKNKKLE